MNDTAAHTEIQPEWGGHAPRGARSVFNRIVKEGANVPLFLSQTLVSALRDVGYNHTTSAVCEHIDNAIEWGSTEVRIYFHQHSRRGGRGRPSYKFDVIVLDNGRGMDPKVLRAVMAFGGSLRYDNREGIGRYGVGMKTAALSIGPVLEVYSWQESAAFYRMMLDTESIGNDSKNLVTLPDAEFLDSLPPEIRDTLTTPEAFPRDSSDQDLLTSHPEELTERLGPSGTLIYIPDCDRLTYRSAKSLVEHATKETARIYRRQLAAGLCLYVNNRRIEPFDPTYSLPSARHGKINGLQETTSRIICTPTVDIPESEDSHVTHPVTIRLFRLPIEDWDQQPRKVLKNDLRIYDFEGISFMRSDREVHNGRHQGIVGKWSSADHWWRLEVDFPAALDEAFGVSFNKQGVRPKSYVVDLIKKTIRDELRVVREHIKRYWSQRVTEQAQPKLSEAERRATEAEAMMATLLPQPRPRTEEEQRVLDENLRTLSVMVKREGETDDQAFERVQESRYVVVFKHDEDAAFYSVETQHGRVILTLNSAHAFFDKLYKPLSEIAARAALPGAVDDGDDDESGVDPELAKRAAEALVSLQILLLTLGRTQAEMTLNNADLHPVFRTVRKTWSNNLEVMLHQG